MSEKPHQTPRLSSATRKQNCAMIPSAAPNHASRTYENTTAPAIPPIRIVIEEYSADHTSPGLAAGAADPACGKNSGNTIPRSEERRVGKACRSRETTRDETQQNT